jgi:hypothetical protein
MELDSTSIAHWAERFAQDEQATVRAAFEKHGENGFFLWLIGMGFEINQVFSIDQTIEGCPWPAHKGSAEDLVKQTFGSGFSGTLSAFAGRCVAAYRLFHYGSWFQVYVVREGEDFRLMAGGPPNLQPTISEEFSESSWSIPYLLSNFYKSHDGFGPMEHASSFWFEDAILPSAALAPLTRYMHFGEDISYNPTDSLLFSPDGGGNGFCFQRSGLSDSQPKLIFWNCSDREIEDGPTFLTLLKQLTAPREQA